ncbi:hypothetical protein [Methylibium sp.]|uniref:hypothetical protein n=1 Tax=Methylibium sp. TaxID=2067992 RepID=UPI0017B45909|nr:hypothetical protein [Methylibium sp.]MBA3591596.1 hypothetical protein [Methylibium sp.]
MPDKLDKKPGPVAKPGERRMYRIGVYFNAAELVDLERVLGEPGFAASIMDAGPHIRKGMKAASRYLRCCAVGKRAPRPVPVLNRAMCAELGRLGKNVRDIGDGLTAGSIDPTEPDMIESIFDELKSLREQLVKVQRLAPDVPEFKDLMPHEEFFFGK